MIVIPVSAQFEVNEGCTHSCSHCYNYFLDYKKNNPTNNRVSLAIAKSGVFNLTLTGGEPLMDKKQLYSTIDLLNDETIDFSINTNLHLLEREDSRILKDKRINSILTSILGPNERIHDSITRKQGAFKKLMESLDYLSKEKIPFAVNMVVTEDNFNDIYKTGKMLYERFGLKKFCATPKVPSQKERSMLSRKKYIKTLDTLLQLSNDLNIGVESLHPTLPCIFEDEEREKYNLFFETRGCITAKRTVTFSKNGNVKICPHAEQFYGNIIDESLRSIIKKMDSWTMGDFIPSECNDCVYLYNCRGGCRISAEIINGSLKSIHPYFTKPITEKKKKKKQDINLKNLKVIGKKIRYREDGDNIYTIYANPSSYLTTDELGLAIFRRYMACESFNEISKEVGSSRLENYSRIFAQRGLLIEEKKQ